MDKKFKPRIIGALRKLSYSYPARTQAKNNAKIAPATYTCASCSIKVYEGAKSLKEALNGSSAKGYKAGKIKMDHVHPIVPVNGFARGEWDWHEYILNMMCEIDGWQALCEECHDVKTKEENKVRRSTKDANIKKGKK